MFIVLVQDAGTEEPRKAYGPFEDEAAASVCLWKEAAENGGWARSMEVEAWPAILKGQPGANV